MDTTILVITHRNATLSDSDVATAGRIIVPLDGSELALSALDPASRLARRLGTRVELMTTRVPDGPPAPVLTTFLDDIADVMDEVETSTVARPERDPAVAIEAMLAETDEPSLVIMSSHGRGRVAHAVLGSVADAVVAKADVPVIVVGPAFDPDPFSVDGPVVLAHDGVHTPNVEDVARVARACGGEIHIIEVVPTTEPVPLEHCSPSAEACAQLLRDAGCSVRCEARTGDDSADIIVEQATLERASFVAVTTRVEEGLPRLAHGSVSAKVVHASPVPVLVMPARPADDIVQV